MARLSPEERRALASRIAPDEPAAVGTIQTKADPNLLSVLEDMAEALSKEEPPEAPGPDYTKGIDALTKAVAALKDQRPLIAIADAIASLAKSETESPEKETDYSPLMTALIQAVDANTRAIQEQTKAMGRPRKVEYDASGTPTGLRLA